MKRYQFWGIMLVLTGIRFDLHNDIWTAFFGLICALMFLLNSIKDKEN